LDYLSQVGVLILAVDMHHKERKKDDFGVATNMKYGVVSFVSWFMLICNSEIGIMRIRGAMTTTSSF
jgi:hypothetical protein